MGTDTARIDLLTELWRVFAEHEAGPYSRLYAAIARSVAGDRRLLDRIIVDVPPSAHLPIALLAAVHDLVLRGTDHPLGEAYAGSVVATAPTLFAEFCDAHWGAIVDTLQHRRVQTNECGRSAPIALALAKVTETVGPVAALIDAGASAGLNLLYDRYCLDFGALGMLGDRTSRVRVTCDVTGPGYQLPADLPTFAHRVGIDRDPIDVTSEDDRRWLLACVWPDTGRLERTAAALRIAAAHPPDIRRGHMVGDLASTIDSTGVDGTVCVMTSWAAAYLSRGEREQFIAVLDDLGRQREVVWLSLEHAAVVDLFVAPDDAEGFEIDPSVVGLCRFRSGARQRRALALVHPHGRSLRWL